MSSPYSNSEQHFFLPDFRSSMASTSTAGGTSIAPSLAQRGSVASTMYRQNAIVSPLPAQPLYEERQLLLASSRLPPVQWIFKAMKRHQYLKLTPSIPSNLFVLLCLALALQAQFGAHLNWVQSGALNITKKKDLTLGDSPSSIWEYQCR